MRATRSGHGRFGGAVIGAWEGLTVLRFPYVDASSVLMIDTQRLLTKLRCIDEPNVVTVSFQELPAESTNESNAATASPKPEDSRVLVTLEALPLIGIANIEAASRIDLRESDGVYTIDETQKTYHRSVCSEIGGRNTKSQLWPPSGMTACTKCRPDRWDVDARWNGTRDDQVPSGD